jgi:hypothetical protein
MKIMIKQRVVQRSTTVNADGSTKILTELCLYPSRMGLESRLPDRSRGGIRQSGGTTVTADASPSF